MALSRVKTWNAAETLTAADLNAEFNNICNHFGSLDNDDIDSTATYTMGELIVGSGIASADGGQLHVHTATAGTIQASADADEAVFENSGASGVTILSGASSTGNIAFGDSGDADNGLLKYTHGATPTLGITVDATAVQSIAAAATTLAHDLAIYQDANNADSQIALGTGSAEALFVEALNGASNKTLEELRFTTKTASGTANHGKMSFYVDEVNIGNVNDDGITLESGKIFTGNITGDVTGNASGTAATVTGGTQAAITTCANLVTTGTIGTGVWQGTAVALAYGGTGLVGATDGKIVIADGSGAPVLLDVGSSTAITVLGTVATGTWEGTAVASAYLDADTAHLSTTQTFTGAKTFTANVTGGVDGTGVDLKLFGDSPGSYLEWDQSEDQLRILGPSADAAASSGKLLLATAQTSVESGDILGQLDFQAPLETGTDAVKVSASVRAVAQGTFAANVNATDLIFYTAHDDDVAERFRFSSQGEIGIAGANYGTDGQVLTSGGASAAVAWEDAAAGVSLSGSTDNTVATVTGANALAGEAELTFDGTDLAIGNAAPSSYIDSVHGLIIGDTSDATSEIVLVGATGSGVSEINFTDTVSTSMEGGIHYDHSDNSMKFGTLGSFQALVIDQNANTFTNETENSFSTIAHTINQGTTDNEILAFKSGDVAHGVTDETETDTYGLIRKTSDTEGGTFMASYASSSNSMWYESLVSGGTTTKSTTSAGPFVFNAAVKSGTAKGSLGADSNILAIQTNGTARFVFDVEGSGHADIEWTTYDTYDDLATINEMETVLLTNELPEQTPRRHAMEATGIIGKDSWHMEDGKPRAMVNFSKLAMLHHGALIQTGDRFKRLEDRLLATEDKLALAESKLQLLEAN